MKLTNIARLRLVSQQVGGSLLKSPQQVVAWMGAVQAQDFPMAKWAIGLRLAGGTQAEIEAAFNRGEILRTHVLRPTWHFVSADDIDWLLALTAPGIKTALRSRHKSLGLDDQIFTRSSAIIENSLGDGQHLTREALAEKLAAANIPIDENRIAHLLMHAELDGLVCSGKILHGKPTYALLSERVARRSPLSVEEALAKLATLYFSTRSPAALQDFSWWSGLPTPQARHAFELVKADFHVEFIEGRSYCFSDSSSAPPPAEDTAFLLPAYDEFLISYQDRTAALPGEYFNTAVSSNGVFRPTIVVNGKVAGLWKRTVVKKELKLEYDFFANANVSLNTVEQAAAHYLRFLTDPPGLRSTNDYPRSALG
jgi:hypothetical protein